MREREEGRERERVMKSEKQMKRERGDLKRAWDPACLGVNPSCGPCLSNLDTTPFIASSMK